MKNYTLPATGPCACGIKNADRLGSVYVCKRCRRLKKLTYRAAGCYAEPAGSNKHRVTGRYVEDAKYGETIYSHPYVMP